MCISYSTPTAETTAASESRSYQMATTSTSQTDTESCSVWETSGRGCRVETEACLHWPSSSPGSALWTGPHSQAWTSRGRTRHKEKNQWTQWSRLESCLRSSTVPASTRDEAAAQRHLRTDVSWGGLPHLRRSTPAGEAAVNSAQSRLIQLNTTQVQSCREGRMTHALSDSALNLLLPHHPFYNTVVNTAPWLGFTTGEISSLSRSVDLCCHGYNIKHVVKAMVLVTRNEGFPERSQCSQGGVCV